MEVAEKYWPFLPVEILVFNDTSRNFIKSENITSTFKETS